MSWFKDEKLLESQWKLLSRPDEGVYYKLPLMERR